MTPEELNAIRERCDAATPTPWIHDSETKTLTFPHFDGYLRSEDCEFIAKARSDVPILLDEVERLNIWSSESHVTDLEAENSKLREALEFYAHWEEKTANAWSKTYERTVLSVDYPGPSKAREALKK